jgi:hypothetical protein
MSVGPLKVISEAKLAEILLAVPQNLNRYESGDFLDLERDNGWAIESTEVTIDYSMLTKLDGRSKSADSDIENSRIVYASLKGMTPAFACEERVWVRLSHIECLNYSRSRWLSGLVGEKLEKAIMLHMFAGGRTGVRDDNAVSRLWWNMHIAHLCDPVDPENALRLIVKSADIRMQFVERPGTAARRPLARAVVRAMRREPWLTATEDAFRRFMVALNRDGGGVLFEALTDIEADKVMDKCIAHARER